VLLTGGSSYNTLKAAVNTKYSLHQTQIQNNTANTLIMKVMKFYVAG